MQKNAKLQKQQEADKLKNKQKKQKKNNEFYYSEAVKIFKTT